MRVKKSSGSSQKIGFLAQWGSIQLPSNQPRRRVIQAWIPDRLLIQKTDLVYTVQVQKILNWVNLFHQPPN